MQVNISVNDASVTLAASNTPPTNCGAAVSSVDQEMPIALNAKPTVPTSLSLTRGSRSVRVKIMLCRSDVNDSTKSTQSRTCIRLTQIALAKLESETEAKEADCPCIRWYSVRNRTRKTVSRFLGHPQPALLHQPHIPDADIDVHLFTYR